MKPRCFFVALLLLMTGSQTLDAQKVAVLLKNDQTIRYDVSQVEAIMFEEEEDMHEYVDLGLPSGTLWATCNIGANSPEEKGYYISWGETQPKEEYTWDTYKYCRGSLETMTKYNVASQYGLIDNLTELLPEDDAATMNWGPSWQMPSREQVEELINSEYTTMGSLRLNDKWCLQITSNINGNSIYLPVAGRIGSDGLYTGGCYYWTRTLYLREPYRGWYLYFSGGAYSNQAYRSSGYTIRPVRRL